MQKDLSVKNTDKTSFADMEFKPLKEQETLSITLDKLSPAFMFEDGKSYYTALSIPNANLPRKLKFKTYISTSYLPMANAFFPQFILLSQDKKPLSDIKKFRLNSDSDFFLGGYFEGSVVIPAEAYYVVVYTSTNNPTNVSLSAENGHEFNIPSAPAGKIALDLSKTFPANYDFSTVLIKDNVKIYSTSKADFFYVASVNDKTIPNSLIKTRTTNAGRGLNMNPVLIDRELSMEPVTLTLVARTEYAAPILALTNTVYEVKGQISFKPEKNKSYVVMGELGETYSAVWLEEESTHKIVDKKIEIKGSAKLGVLEK